MYISDISYYINGFKAVLHDLLHTLVLKIKLLFEKEALVVLSVKYWTDIFKRYFVNTVDLIISL